LEDLLVFFILEFVLFFESELVFGFVGGCAHKGLEFGFGNGVFEVSFGLVGFGLCARFEAEFSFEGLEGCVEIPIFEVLFDVFVDLVVFGFGYFEGHWWGCGLMVGNLNFIYLLIIKFGI
jgi:hypothetical protein